MLRDTFAKLAAIFGPSATRGTPELPVSVRPDSTHSGPALNRSPQLAYVETLCRYWDATIDIIQDHMRDEECTGGAQLDLVDTARRLRARSRGVAASDPIVALLCEWQAKLMEGTLTHRQIFTAWWPTRNPDGHPDLNHLATWCREKLVDDPQFNVGIDLNRIDWQLWAEVVYQSNAEVIVKALKPDR